MLAVAEHGRSGLMLDRKIVFHIRIVAATARPLTKLKGFMGRNSARTGRGCFGLPRQLVFSDVEASNLIKIGSE
jgi:ribosomal protein L5